MNSTKGKNSINYRGYLIHLRRDSQTKRVNGAIILGSSYFTDENRTFDSLTSAKRVIDIIEGEPS